MPPVPPGTPLTPPPVNDLSHPVDRRTDRVWIGLSPRGLPLDQAVAWCTQSDCGAVVTFTGTVRDHAEGRTGVVALTYEAYEGPALDRLEAVAGDVLVRWPEVRRIAIHHRVGTLSVGEPAVVVVVATGHRAEAFAAASHAIDATKATVPIWKHEVWATGSGWGTGAQPIAEVTHPADVTGPVEGSR